MPKLPRIAIGLLAASLALAKAWIVYFAGSETDLIRDRIASQMVPRRLG